MSSASVCVSMCSSYVCVQVCACFCACLVFILQQLHHLSLCAYCVIISRFVLCDFHGVISHGVILTQSYNVSAYVGCVHVCMRT